MREHSRDPYVRQARGAGLRSRAVFKLEELDRRHKLFRPGQSVVDLGAAPGSWSEYAGARVAPGGAVIAIDLLAMPALANVTFLQGDITDAHWRQTHSARLRQAGVDLVISDMAPNLSGIAALDQTRVLELATTAFEFARDALQPRGHFLVKLFEGGDSAAFRKQLMGQFQQVILCKPRASRARSAEIYLLAKDFSP